MPTEVEQAVTAIQAALAQVPGALIVVVLLGGPTALWFLYRALNASAPQRRIESASDLLWVCPSCRSVNGIGARSCYRCNAVPDDQDLEIITPDPIAPASAPPPMILPALERAQRPMVAVGPGRRPTADAPSGGPAAPATTPAPTTARTQTAATRTQTTSAAQTTSAKARTTSAATTSAKVRPTAPKPPGAKVPSAKASATSRGATTPATTAAMQAATPATTTTTTPRRRRASATAVAEPPPPLPVEPTADPDPAETPVPVAARSRRGR